MTRGFSELTDGERREFESNLRPANGHLIWRGSMHGATPMYKVDGKYVRARLLTLQRAGNAPVGTIRNTCGHIRCVDPKHLAWKPATVAAPTAAEYNAPQRNPFSLDANPDLFLPKLRALRTGKTVVLEMDNPKYRNVKNFRGSTKHLVILAPGAALNLHPEAVVVSVIGLGSCIVWPKRYSKIADLVLAGMPAKLAIFLMQKLHRVFKE